MPDGATDSVAHDVFSCGLRRCCGGWKGEARRRGREAGGGGGDAEAEWKARRRARLSWVGEEGMGCLISAALLITQIEIIMETVLWEMEYSDVMVTSAGLTWSGACSMWRYLLEVWWVQ